VGKRSCHGVGEGVAGFGTAKLDDYDMCDFFGGGGMVEELEGWEVKRCVIIGE